MTDVRTTVQHAAHSDTMSLLARVGLAARATIYVLIGVLALAIAFGTPGKEADQRGAMQEVARHGGGTLLLWVLVVGLAGYALWRFSEAAFGVAGEGRKAGPRVQSFVRGCLYAFFALNAVRLITESGGPSQAGQQEVWTARVMSYSAGRWVVGIIGAIVVVVGLALMVEGLRQKFKKHLELGRMGPTARRVVVPLGVIGTTARGAVFALAGVLLIRAAQTYDARKARGIDGALRSLADTSAGPWLLVAAALGLLAFGAYGYAEAIWRRT